MTGMTSAADGWFTADHTGRGADLAAFDAAADELTVPALRPRLLRAWVLGGSQDALGTERWVALFRRAGYTRDGVPCALPEQPVRLWRGGRHGVGRLAWSTSRTVAEQYAADPVGGPRRRSLWMTVAPVAALLAERTGDAEVVVDPALLGAVEEMSTRRTDPFGEARPTPRGGLRMTLGGQPTRLDRVMGGQPEPRYSGTTMADVLAGEVRAARQREERRRALWASPTPACRPSWRDSW